MRAASWAGRKKRRRSGEVGVGFAVAGEDGADAGEDLAKIPAVEGAEDAVGGLGEFEDGESAAGFEEAEHFAEAVFVIGEIAEAESGGEEVEGIVGEGEAEGVGFEEGGARRGFGVSLD